MKPNMQQKLLLQLKDKTVFSLAQEYAMSYLDDALERPVFPAQDALDLLSKFDEAIPVSSTEPKDILNQLHTYGSPATVSTLGGRYFGFVTGSALPIGLATKHLATYWDQAPAMYVLSPISSKLEAVVEKWLIELFNLTKRTCAEFVSGTS
ncbi:hypothetical protein L3X39_00030 [Sabulilitoribacter multivorans]|uniref:Uncharacterized protein n=1 Tax=Flaviramulus multivorans TaxID=1304750 RepID=A0ABS9IE03_9FLAO|nr:hypothetical protein [Flaviramulus multivorans]MCF7559007.1 hypothetical protein [Flaviramulus multivorans]